MFFVRNDVRTLDLSCFVYNQYMQIADVPSEEFRMWLLVLMVGDLGGCFIFERSCRFMFRKQPNSLIPMDHVLGRTTKKQTTTTNQSTKTETTTKTEKSKMS